ncbi:MAG TPA: YdcF family protein [Terriglobales bacterium]
MALLGVLGLLLVSWPPADWLLSRHLEARYPRQRFPDARVEAIVVLSAGTAPAHYARQYGLPNRETYQRCEYAAWLYKNWQSVPVLACGGVGRRDLPPLSITMRELLKRAGVPEALIWTEEQSRSTHENAVYGAEILRKHGIRRIALVVEARSMPRAAACFRKEGMLVTPAPSAFRYLTSWSEELIPGPRAIEHNEATLHETLGLVWYWLRGWI